MSRNIVFILMYHRHKLLDLNIVHIGHQLGSEELSLKYLRQTMTTVRVLYVTSETEIKYLLNTVRKSD
jgi:hypothetical protein